jgi:imidazolonepropionase-like amidohydrolase
VRRALVAAAFVVTLVPGLRAAAGAGSAPPARVILADVTVIDGNGAAPLAHRDVVLAGDRIVAVAATGSVDRRDATVVALPGRWVTPGFIDLHAHLWLHPWDEQGAIRPRWDREAALASLRLLLAHGVTTVRDPGAETEAAVALREAVRAGKVLGPTIFTAGRMLNASDFAPEPFARVRSPAEVEREIRWQAALGVDAIKVYGALPPALVAHTIAVAHGLHLPVIGHLQATSWTEAAALGIDCIEHAAPWSADYLAPDKRAGYGGDLWARVYWLEQLDLDSPAVRALVAALVAHDVTVDPTLVAMWTKLYGDVAAADAAGVVRAPAAYRAGWPAGSFTAGWSAAQYRRAHAVWPKLLAFVGRLHAGGVRLTVGTDTPTPWIVPGASVHQEMALLGDAGLAPLAVLRAATTDAARALGQDSRLGRVAAGYRADLVVLTRDPTRAIANSRAIERVYRGGVAYTPSELLP